MTSRRNKIPGNSLTGRSNTKGNHHKRQFYQLVTKWHEIIEWLLTISSEDIFSKLQTARTPSSNNRENAPRNWKASEQPASR